MPTRKVADLNQAYEMVIYYTQARSLVCVAKTIYIKKKK